MDILHTGPPGHTPTPARPSYAPPDRRWNEASGGNPRRYHASGHWRPTLCGLAADDLTDHGAQWRPGRAGACPGCSAAAEHLTVSRRGRLRDPIDDALTARGHERRVATAGPTPGGGGGVTRVTRRS